eukprot:139421-Amphidinium_carterae.1
MYGQLNNSASFSTSAAEISTSTSYNNLHRLRAPHPPDNKQHYHAFTPATNHFFDAHKRSHSIFHEIQRIHTTLSGCNPPSSTTTSSSSSTRPAD